MLAGTVLLLAGLAGAAPAHGAGDVIARLGPLTVSATALRPGPAGTLTTYMQVSTSGQPSDQLDAAIAADGAAVAVYHQQVSVGEISDLTGCGTETSAAGRGGPVAALRAAAGPRALRRPVPARGRDLDGTRRIGTVPAGATLAITLYFAHAGSVILRLPVSRG